MDKEELVRSFDFGLKANKLPPPVKEFVFHPTRKWRFDRAWPEQKVAVEVNGGVWSGGRHVRGSGYIKDREKVNEAQLLGWTVIEVVDKTIENEQAFEWVRRALYKGD